MKYFKTNVILYYRFGIETAREGFQRVAYLANFKTSLIQDEDLIERSVLCLYFMEKNGNWFQAFLKYQPYFYVTAKQELLRYFFNLSNDKINKCRDVMSSLERKFEGKLASAEIVEKVDLDVVNHLSGVLNKYIKLSFRTISVFN